MNIFKEMALSIYSYGSYGQFLKNKKSKVFGFGVLLMLLYFLIVYLIPGVVNMGSTSQMVETIRAEVPNFKLEDGVLWMEDTFEVDTDSNYLYINTTPGFSLPYTDESEVTAAFGGYRQAILMDSEKAIVKDENGDVNILYFSNLDIDFERKDIEGLLPWFLALYYVLLGLLYIWITALFFFGVLFVALLGMIAASCMKYQITFGKLYLMGVYSRTLSLLIKAVVSFLPFQIPFFWVINFGLSLFILVMAMKKLREQEAQAPIAM